MDSVVSGTFLLSKSENAAAAFATLGISASEAAMMTDPSRGNKVEVTAEGNRVLWHETFPGLPKFCTSYDCAFGETQTRAEPINMTLTMNKKDGRTLTVDMLTGGNTSFMETIFTPEGFSQSGHCNGVQMSMEWTRQEPEVCGMFLLEDPTSMTEFLVSQAGMERALLEKVMGWVSFRNQRVGDTYYQEEVIGTTKLTREWKLGEEFDNSNDLTGPEVAIITSDFPGQFTMVTRNQKSGFVITWEMVFNSRGFKGTGSMASGASCNFSYRRIPDIQGKWKLVAKQGLEAQLEALGITGKEKQRLLPIYFPRLQELKVLGDGAFHFMAEGDYPAIKFFINEEYSYTWFGATYSEVTTWKPDMTGFLTVSKTGDKIARTVITTTKNFHVVEMEFDGLPNSKATAIYTRI